MRAEAEGLTGRNGTLKQLVLFAYDLQGYQLSGPDWIETEGYDVAAKAKNSAGATQLRLMLQTLLEDRFKLQSHRETKEIPAYWLGVAKGGPKLRDAKEGEDAFAALTKDGKSPFKPGLAAIFKPGDLPAFAERLGRPLDRPVLDKTGIKGQFWFQLEWAPDPGPTGTVGAANGRGPGLTLALRS